MRTHVSLIALSLVALTAGCTKSQLVDIAMSGAARPASHRGMQVGGRMVLAGDMHCHVRPPDSPRHVSRDLEETLALAKDESLDFVVLAPHVRARFFEDDDARRSVTATQTALRDGIARRRPDLIVVPGFEYTDPRYGHVGASFADPREVLDGLPTADAEEHPERFFEMWVARGGVLTVNHPMNRPLPGAPFHELSADMSWRAFASRAEAPAEIAWITRHAQALEIFNEMTAQLRDQFMLGDEDRSLREAANVGDHLARAQQRRIAFVGGTDSHGHWLRATTFVLADARSREGVRDAIVGGRTCVRGPEACTFEARTQGGAWLGVGDAITTPPAQRTTFEARATGDDVSVVVNGAIVATAASGETVKVEVPTDRCAILRVVVGRSWSSGIYVNCF